MEHGHPRCELYSPARFRRFLDAAQRTQLQARIDRAYDLRMAQANGESWKSWFDSLKRLLAKIGPRRPTVRQHGDGLDGR